MKSSHLEQTLKIIELNGVTFYNPKIVEYLARCVNTPETYCDLKYPDFIWEDNDLTQTNDIELLKDNGLGVRLLLDPDNFTVFYRVFWHSN